MSETTNLLFTQWNVDSNGNKISIQIDNEQHQIVNGKFILSQIPDEYNHIQITGYTEINKSQTITSATQFKVNYVTSEVSFHPSKEGQTITVTKFYGRGLIYIDASRIATLNNGQTVTQTLDELTTLTQSSTASTITATNNAITATVLTNTAITNANTATTTINNTNTAMQDFEVYNNAKAYVPLNKVTLQGSSYVNILGCTGVSPTVNGNNSNWLLIAQKGVSLTTNGAWSSSTTYNNNSNHIDLVSYQGGTFYSIQDNNTNHLPTDASWWGVFAQAGSGTNVGSSTTNGNVLINSTETTVYNDTTLSNKIGNLGSLNTTDKSSSVNAINENVTRLDGHTTQLAEKANQIAVNTAFSLRDSAIASLASGSPKGTYATVSALTTAIPTGNTNIYVITTDGHWYYWNGSAWTSGGVYQSTGIAVNSVSNDKLSYLLQNDIHNIQNKLGTVSLFNDFSSKTFTSTTGTGTTRVLSTPIANDCTLRQINVSCTVGGTLLIKLLTKNVNGTFNFIKNITMTVVSGVNYIEVDEQLLNGYYIGFYSTDVIVRVVSETNTYYYIAGDMTGNNITLSSNGDSNYGISLLTISLNNVDLLPLKYLDATTETIGIEGAVPGSMTKGYTRIINKKYTVSCVLKEIVFYADAIGSMKVKSFTSINESVFTLQEETTINIPQVGINIIKCSLPVYVNGYIGLYSTEVFIPHSSATSLYGYFTSAGDITNSATFTQSTTADIRVKTTVIKYDALDYLNLKGSVNTISGQITQVNNNISTLTTNVNNVVTNSQNIKLLDKYLLARTTFATLPTGWVNNGFTVNNGLQSPITGGTDKIAYWNIYSTLDKQIIRARIKIVNITSSFALFKKYTLHGGIGVVDCQNNVLNLYKSWAGGTLPDVNASTPITIPIVANREYIVSYEKNGCIHKLTLSDTVTGLSNTVSFDNSTVLSTGYCGKQWGAPGVMFLSGDILVRKFEFICNAPSNPKVSIMGDSITEGFALDNNTATYEDRWSAKIRATLNGNCVISGRGGGDSADLITRLDFDLDKFTPQYVVILMGANDTVLNTWETNMNTIISRILAKNTIPILCALPSGTLRVEMSAYLRTLPYTVVGFDYACSTNHDGVTIDQSLFVDGLHPNITGSLKMYNQFLLDAPEVFE